MLAGFSYLLAGYMSFRFSENTKKMTAGMKKIGSMTRAKMKNTNAKGIIVVSPPFVFRILVRLMSEQQEHEEGEEPQR